MSYLDNKLKFGKKKHNITTENMRLLKTYLECTSYLKKILEVFKRMLKTYKSSAL